MIPNPKVSIIVLNWNGKKWLDQCITSLLGQTYKNIELILVDNDSTDGSVKKIEEKYPSIKLVSNNKNLGFAGGNNSGIAIAKGELIMLMNNDAWAEPKLVEKLVNFYTLHDFAVVAPHEAAYDGSIKRPDYSTTIDPWGYPVYRQTGENFYLSGVCILFSRQLYIETGGLDPDFFMYFEEIDWFWRLHLLDKKISYVPDAYVHHVGGGSTGGLTIRYKAFLWRNQNIPQMLIKNYSFANLLWTLPTYIGQNLIEIIGFLLVLKPKIALSYLEGWWFNVRLFSRTLKKRKEIQKIRITPESQILEKMYHSSGKLKHLVERIKKAKFAQSTYEEK